MNIRFALRLVIAAALAVAPLRAFAAEDTEKKKEDAPAAEAAADPKSGAPAIKLETEEDRFSYILGAETGMDFKRNRLLIQRESFVAGLDDIAQKKPAAMTDEEIDGVLQKVREKLTAAQAEQSDKSPLAGDDALIKQLSYVLGADTATRLVHQHLEVKNGPFVRAIEDALAGRELAMTRDEMKVVIDAYRQKEMEKMKLAGEKNLADGKMFLAENAKKPGVKSTASGLQYLVVEEGKGESPKATDTVRTHYRGTLIDGTEFDSSYSRNEPTEFPVNGVISGWTEALQLMHVGDKWKLFIPAELAYGERGAGGTIGPNSTLIFDIELLEIKKPKAEEPSDGSISLDAAAGGKKAN